MEQIRVVHGLLDTMRLLLDSKDPKAPELIRIQIDHIHKNIDTITNKINNKHKSRKPYHPQSHASPSKSSFTLCKFWKAQCCNKNSTECKYLHLSVNNHPTHCPYGNKCWYGGKQCFCAERIKSRNINQQIKSITNTNANKLAPHNIVPITNNNGANNIDNTNINSNNNTLCSTSTSIDAQSDGSCIPNYSWHLCRDSCPNIDGQTISSMKNMEYETKATEIRDNLCNMNTEDTSTTIDHLMKNDILHFPTKKTNILNTTNNNIDKPINTSSSTTMLNISNDPNTTDIKNNPIIQQTITNDNENVVTNTNSNNNNTKNSYSSTINNNNTFKYHKDNCDKFIKSTMSMFSKFKSRKGKQEFFKRSFNGSSERARKAMNNIKEIFENNNNNDLFDKKTYYLWFNKYYTSGIVADAESAEIIIDMNNIYHEYLISPYWVLYLSILHTQWMAICSNATDTTVFETVLLKVTNLIQKEYGIGPMVT